MSTVIKVAKNAVAALNAAMVLVRKQQAELEKMSALIVAAQAHIVLLEKRLEAVDDDA